MTYYTLRKAGDPQKPIYALAKWEDGEVTPSDVYVQWVPQRGDGSYMVHSCNCPSRNNPCKHAAMATDLLGKAHEGQRPTEFELASLYWEEGVVKETGDQNGR